MPPRNYPGFLDDGGFYLNRRGDIVQVHEEDYNFFDKAGNCYEKSGSITDGYLEQHPLDLIKKYVKPEQVIIKHEVIVSNVMQSKYTIAFPLNDYFYGDINNNQNRRLK